MTLTKRSKIIIAILGGCLVGGVNVVAIIWPNYNVICGIAATLVCMLVATITGIIITKEAK